MAGDIGDRVTVGTAAAADRPATITLSRDTAIVPLVVFVDGISRSGKSMLCPILSSFERVEIERAEEIIEYVGALYGIGKISRDVAVTLLRLETDMHLYNSMIGRNTNFRFNDHSSVWKSSVVFRYLKRVVAADGQRVLERIERERPIYQNQTHDQLAHFELFDEAFGGRLRIVEMIRHPVDLMDSWMRRGWGTRFGEDPLALTIGIDHRGIELPYYALGWEDEYVTATPLGRVVRMIAHLWYANRCVYDTLTGEQGRRVFVIPFEDFVQRPEPYLGPLAAFVGSRPTRRTSAALGRERCPRTYSVEARRQKRHDIERQASADEREIVVRLVDDYEEMAGRVALSGG